MTKRYYYDYEDPVEDKIIDFREDKEYPLGSIGGKDAIADLLNYKDKLILELMATIKLIGGVKSIKKEHSVKQLLQNRLYELKVGGLEPTMSNEYYLLDKLFREGYLENWEDSI